MLWASWALLALLGLQIALRLLGVAASISLDMLTIEVQADLIDEHSADAILQRLAWLIRLTSLRSLSWLLLAPGWWTWTALCNQLVRAYGLEPSRRPIGTVLWWFVPLANLVVPVRVIAELWQASQRPEPIVWRQIPVSRMVPAWWASFWLLLGLRAFVLVRVFAQGRRFVGFDDLEPEHAEKLIRETMQTTRELLRAEILQQATGIAACVLAIVLVVQISKGLRRGRGPRVNLRNFRANKEHAR
jgi:hypothetical protein